VLMLRARLRVLDFPVSLPRQWGVNVRSGLTDSTTAEGSPTATVRHPRHLYEDQVAQRLLGVIGDADL